MSDNEFIALDLAGAVCGIAACEEAPGTGLGWVAHSFGEAEWVGSR